MFNDILITMALLCMMFSNHTQANDSQILDTRTDLTKQMSAQAKVIAGWVEFVSFPEVKALVKAKLDTGAKTSSLHAENIERFEKNNEKWVRFDMVFITDDKKTVRKTLEKPRVRGVKIKNHDGVHDSRSVVDIDFCFDGRLYSAEFTLANRSEYIYPVLLGRRFLKGVAVVDPDKTFKSLSGCVSAI